MAEVQCKNKKKQGYHFFTMFGIEESRKVLHNIPKGRMPKHAYWVVQKLVVGRFLVPLVLNEIKYQNGELSIKNRYIVAFKLDEFPIVHHCVIYNCTVFLQMNNNLLLFKYLVLCGAGQPGASSSTSAPALSGRLSSLPGGWADAAHLAGLQRKYSRNITNCESSRFWMLFNVSDMTHSLLKFQSFCGSLFFLEVLLVDWEKIHYNVAK